MSCYTGLVAFKNYLLKVSVSDSGNLGDEAKTLSSTTQVEKHCRRQIPAALSAPGCHSENKSSQCQVREVANCLRVSPKEFVSNLLSHGLNLKWVCERQGDLALVLLGDF